MPVLMRMIREGVGLVLGCFASFVLSSLRIPLMVNAGSGIVNSDSTDRDHAVGAKRR